MEEQIIELVCEHFGISEAETTLALEIRKDLNATDLEIADFFLTLEKRFNVTISKDDAAKFETISDIVSYITDHAEETS